MEGESCRKAPGRARALSRRKQEGYGMYFNRAQAKLQNEGFVKKAPEKVVEVDYNARYTHQPEEVQNTPSQTGEIPPEGKPTDHI